MDEKPPHFLRQWREKKGWSQQELADAVGTSKSTISDLERFVLQLSPKWLRRLAPVLDTQQGYLIDQNPENISADILDIWAKIHERDREQAARVLKSFVKTGTDDR